MDNSMYERNSDTGSNSPAPEAIKASYRTISSSADTMVFEPIVLDKREPTERSRKILKATGVRNMHNSRHCLKICLGYQKRHNKGTSNAKLQFQNLDRIRLSSLKGGQEIQVDLDCSQTAQLAEHLQNLYAIASEGITVGISERVVVDADFLAQLAAAINDSSIDNEHIIDIICEKDPLAFDVAAHKARHRQHSSALLDFREHLEEQAWHEKDWETFFSNNRWIFGHGLAYQFLSELQEQPNYGGAAIDGKGSQRGDHLMATEASIRFTVLVEVKTPQALLTQRLEYRNGAYALGDDVTGGVAQLQANTRKWALEGSQSEANRFIENQAIYTVQPKGILVVGHTSSLDSHAKRTSFELYRQNLHNPEILTFDELYARAKYIVEHDLQYSRKTAIE